MKVNMNDGQQMNPGEAEIRVKRWGDSQNVSYCKKTTRKDKNQQLINLTTVP